MNSRPKKKQRRGMHPDASSGFYCPQPSQPPSQMASYIGASTSGSGLWVSRTNVLRDTGFVPSEPVTSTFGFENSAGFDGDVNSDSSCSDRACGFSSTPMGVVDADDDGLLSEPEDVIQQTPRPKRHLTSDNPMLVWTRHKPEFLDGLFMHEAHFNTSPHRICVSCRKPPRRSFLCDDCNGGLECLSCSLQSHAKLPLHCIKEWNGSFWAKTSLLSMGLVYQLGHHGQPCPAFSSSSLLSTMVVIDINGIHSVSVRCVSRTDDTFRLLNVAGGVNATDFMSSLLRKVDGGRLVDLPVRTKQFMLMSRQYAWLLRAKRAGYGYQGFGLNAMAKETYAVECWACPHPEKNLPEGWERFPLYFMFLFTLFLALDANFRLKNKLRRNAKDDPPISDGVGYFVPRPEYSEHVLNHAGDVERSSCSAFHALRWDDRQVTGLRASGLVALVCSRHECITGGGVGDLQKGERYANVDFVFFNSIQSVSPLIHILVLYDIACQWSKNLFLRMSNLPPRIQRPYPEANICTGLPVWHANGHVITCRMANSLTVKEGAGRSDGEGPERVWSRNNAMANSTKEQGEGSRRDNLDDKFDYENTCRNLGLVDRLPLKLAIALEEVERQEDLFRSLDEGVNSSQRGEWLTSLSDWERDASQPNPYVLDESDEPSEFQIQAEILREEATSALSSSAVNVHTTSPCSFLILGLEIEAAQARLKTDAENTSGLSTAALIKLNKRRYQIASKISTFREAQRIYMPGAIRAMDAEPSPTEPTPVEKVQLWLPSDLPSSTRRAGCSAGLPEMELKLRKGQVNSLLRDLRKRLYSHKILIERRNLRLRGQRETTRSGSLIGVISARINHDCERYQGIRAAILRLDVPGASVQYPVLSRDDLVVPVEDLEDASARQASNVAGGERSLRSGTSKEVTRGPGWIWQALRVSVELSTDGSQESNWLTACCRVEWLKACARLSRWREEVLLLKEEMRQSLRYLSWKAEWWKPRAALENPSLSSGAARIAYAAKQTKLMEEHHLQWRTRWTTPYRYGRAGQERYLSPAQMDINGPELPPHNSSFCSP
ncbi:hypothetical protein DL96DRAFT_1721325 [Flagelloscypha sp. PMI_526]|nr:hypothetical protein DL96DRAFT_1721325 [Flagelloscypha sp. PMI_526]